MIDLGPWLDAVPTAVVERLTAARRVLAVGHENPDADTLGATLAVCRLVELRGATATAVFADEVPPLYDFLPAAARARMDPDPSIDYDLLVVSDCGALDRIGSVVARHPALFERLPRVVIDHHASNDAAGPGDWIEPDSAATCEMVALLAARLGVPLDLGGGALASELMAGIVMDTATFAHPNATPRTLVVSAALFGRALDRLETAAGGRIIHSTLLDADLTATGSTAPFSEGIIDLLAQSDDAEVAILFKEAGEGTRLSVRTKPGGVDATVLTGLFGGGGHARASGATIGLPVAEARRAVLAEAERLVAAVRR